MRRSVLTWNRNPAAQMAAALFLGGCATPRVGGLVTGMAVQESAQGYVASACYAGIDYITSREMAANDATTIIEDYIRESSAYELDDLGSILRKAHIVKEYQQQLTGEVCVEVLVPYS